jgi:hypothetical protein
VPQHQREGVPAVGAGHEPAREIPLPDDAVEELLRELARDPPRQTVVDIATVNKPETQKI